MGAEQAANTLAMLKVNQLKRAGKEPDPEVIEQLKEQTMEDYLLHSNAYYVTSEIWDDGMIDPVATRNALGISIAASLNAPLGQNAPGVLRV